MGLPVTDMVIPPDREHIPDVELGLDPHPVELCEPARCGSTGFVEAQRDEIAAAILESDIVNKRYLDPADGAYRSRADASLAVLSTEAETKALVETATRLGRELGRREVGEEIAQVIERYRYLCGSDWKADQIRSETAANCAAIAREIATREPK